MTPLTVGLTGTAEIDVTPEVTASAVGSGLVPVFATPRLVALVEMAAVHALDGHLADGDTTVGTRIELSHLAATPVGMHVRAEAALERVEGRLLTFRVAAWDSREKIGEGLHVRAVVARERFLAKVAAKQAG